ncbi:hypothetical protein ACSSS7_007672 [Eimeria intestinalis]
MAAIVAEMVRVNSAAAKDSRRDDAGLGVSDGDAGYAPGKTAEGLVEDATAPADGIDRAGTGNPGIHGPAVARGGLRRGPLRTGGCFFPYE